MVGYRTGLVPLLQRCRGDGKPQPFVNCVSILKYHETFGKSLQGFRRTYTLVEVIYVPPLRPLNQQKQPSKSRDNNMERT